jgi:hypothetical protein
MVSSGRLGSTKGTNFCAIVTIGNYEPDWC